MSRVNASVVLYAVDLTELTDLIGCKDQKAFEAAWITVSEEEDVDWEPEEMAVLEKLLRRIIFDGQTYEGLEPEERYYTTQLLIDLFDEFVDQEALSEDVPFSKLLQTVEALPGKGDARRLASYLVRGRELPGDAYLWTEGSVEDQLSLLGYLSVEECERLHQALTASFETSRERPSGLLKLLCGAAHECAHAGMSLVSFIG